jgi:pyrimidine operon attenuation protein/uracil phosphoribosyltransferase
MNMAEKSRIVLDKEEMSRIITRISHEIVELNKGASNIVLIGILNRGLPLAQRMAKIIETVEKVNVPVGSLDVSLYRDDILHKGAKIAMKTSDIPFSIDGKIVVLVDDVISAGRTIRAALDGLGDYGRASRVELAALIDRDHRELPIHPDFTGKKIATTVDEKVQVSLSEMDGVDKVIVK